MHDITDVLKQVLKEVTPKKKITNPTPAQIQRIIAKKHQQQKRLLKQRKKQAALKSSITPITQRSKTPTNA